MRPDRLRTLNLVSCTTGRSPESDSRGYRRPWCTVHALCSPSLPSFVLMARRIQSRMGGFPQSLPPHRLLPNTTK